MTKNFEQVPFADAGLVDNPEPRCACLLLLDNSGSMRGNPISELNEGLRVFRDELAADALASKRVEVGIVTVGPVKIETDFVSAQSFAAPTLSVAGDTPMGQAIETGLNMLRGRKDAYKANGVGLKCWKDVHPPRLPVVPVSITSPFRRQSADTHRAINADLSLLTDFVEEVGE